MEKGKEAERAKEGERKKLKTEGKRGKGDEQ